MKARDGRALTGVPGRLLHASKCRCRSAPRNCFECSFLSCQPNEGEERIDSAKDQSNPRSPLSGKSAGIVAPHGKEAQNGCGQGKQ